MTKIQSFPGSGCKPGRTRGKILRIGALSLSAFILLGATGQGLEGQSDPGRLALDCGADASQTLGNLCAQSALAAHILQGGVGLLVGAGGALPVSPSTAGQRMEGAPRVVVDGGLNVGRVEHLDLLSSGSTARSTTSTLLAGRITATAGVFEGFSPAPTVGGMGSVDGVVTLRFVRFPSGAGFSGTSASVGAGARLGLLRESFSLPGVTLTALHHRPGTIRYGNLEESGRRVVLKPRVTTARLEVGKDLLALGATGGVGFDRMSGRARIAVEANGEGANAGPVSMTQTRRFVFGGINYTWLVTQISGEVSWSPGQDLPDDFWPREAVSLEDGNLQAAITFRIIY